VLRYHGKAFKQRRPDGNGGWHWGLGNVQRVPFRLPKVHGADFVAICEGEKDVLTLERLGMTATCNNGGAGNFKPELAEHFAGKHVGIFTDNDDVGLRHVLKVAEIVAPVAKSVKIVELPGLPVKGDVTDFVNAGGTIDGIREHYRKAQLWTPDFEFASTVPDENDRYVRTFEQEIEVAGGLSSFWDLARFVGLPTPFARLNGMLAGGLRNGEVYVIGANQGAGKTSLALQFALSALRRGHGVLLFSMEMSHRAVFQRMAGIEAQVDLLAFRSAQRRKQDSQEDRIRLAHATADIAGWKLQVSTKPAVTPEYVISETKRLAKRGPVDLVICDHMQLMEADQSTRSDYEKFTAVSRAMKQTAVEVNVPVLLVSQTSRSNSRERRSDLDVADLRGSGAIEEDAAGVFLLFEDREDADAARSADGCRYTKGPVRCFLKIGKNRYGEQGRCLPLLHFKAQTRFEIYGAEEPDGE
jgi:KaiC/GvpD/RAD55 family RecA-like ATPase